jgi:hypothetical protein
MEIGKVLFYAYASSICFERFYVLNKLSFLPQWRHNPFHALGIIVIWQYQSCSVQLVSSLEQLIQLLLEQEQHVLPYSTWSTYTPYVVPCKQKSDTRKLDTTPPTAKFPAHTRQATKSETQSVKSPSKTHPPLATCSCPRLPHKMCAWGGGLVANVTSLNTNITIYSWKFTK